MGKLWQKDWQLNTGIEFFETKDDLLWDQKLLPSDVLGSIAHAKGLLKIGILSREEYKILVTGLTEILTLADKGQFKLEPGDEDIHTKIENFLTLKYGTVGKKIHTGRSRNDQVLTAIRFHTKSQSLLIWERLLSLIDGMILFSGKYRDVVMPGYTHMQKAMPSSLGMWSSAFAEGLLDSLCLFRAAYFLNNQSPLGSAAGYGIPLNLDREYTAQLMGFESVQINPICCQNSRGKIEGAVLAALVSIFQDLNKFVTDVLVFTTSEFGYFTVDRQLCSGSSIMPQKINIDVAELLRSKVHVILGNYVQIVSLSSNLMSGYNRDVQDSKKPLMESLELAINSLSVALMLLQGITVNRKRIRASLTPELFAAHHAIGLVKKGVAFREAYRQAGSAGADISLGTSNLIHESLHIGGLGNLGIPMLAKRYRHEFQVMQTEKTKNGNAVNHLLEVI